MCIGGLLQEEIQHIHVGALDCRQKTQKTMAHQSVIGASVVIMTIMLDMMMILMMHFRFI